MIGEKVCRDNTYKSIVRDEAVEQIKPVTIHRRRRLDHMIKANCFKQIQQIFITTTNRGQLNRLIPIINDERISTLMPCQGPAKTKSFLFETSPSVSNQ
jgi:hypothetical protein